MRERYPSVRFVLFVPLVIGIISSCGDGSEDPTDVLPSAVIGDVQVAEGDAGTTDAVFTVRVQPLTAKPVFLRFQTADGTATVADGDYQAQEGSVTIDPVAPYEAAITVLVFGDTRPEADETFIVRLAEADGATIADGEGVGTILNDDENSMVRIAAAEPVSEAAGSAAVVVERVNPSGDRAEVTVNAREGTATEGVDFTPVTEVVSWGADEGGTRTVQIPLLDDNRAEDDETIRVVLSDPVEPSLGSPSAIDLTILDDEQDGEVEIVGESEPEAVVEESADLTVRVRKPDGTPIESAQVFWTVEEGEAELTGGNPTLSGADGVSRQTVALGEIPGIVVIRATLNSSTGDPSVVFQVRVREAGVTPRSPRRP